MKLNQWTLGLAAVGAVSLVSAVRADEAKVSQVQTALSSTTLSGYVDVAAQYNAGNNSVGSTIAPGVSTSKIDSFSLNDIDIALDKPQDESPWASGYHVELNTGTDSIQPLGGATSSVGVRQAYVVVRTPVGNGIDWKMGLFDNIVGYEGNTDGANPNYTRSYGYSVEPTSYLGLLGTYKVNSVITVQGGIANTLTSQNGGVPITSTSAKSYIGSVAFTAPDSWGWAKGATLNLGVNVQNSGNYKNDANFVTVTPPATNPNGYANAQQNYTADLVIPTPLAALKVGFAFDYVTYANAYTAAVNSKEDSVWITGAYATYQATDKLSLNLRGEYDKDDVGGNQGEEITATVQYNLWANVISRAEFRWDHIAHGTGFGVQDINGNYATSSAYLAAVNLIYQF